MPSFDIVSEIDHHELTNAVDQANREVNNRFDFKDSGAHFEQKENTITMIAPNDFQLKQMDEIFRNKIVKRSIDIKALDLQAPEISGHEARQAINIKEGIESETAKKIVKAIKNTKLKVQAAIQGEQVRITGKKRDDLQEVMQFLRSDEGDMGIPLQFNNFRD